MAPLSLLWSRSWLFLLWSPMLTFLWVDCLILHSRQVDCLVLHSLPAPESMGVQLPSGSGTDRSWWLNNLQKLVLTWAANCMRLTRRISATRCQVNPFCPESFPDALRPGATCLPKNRSAGMHLIPLICSQVKKQRNPLNPKKTTRPMANYSCM